MKGIAVFGIIAVIVLILVMSGCGTYNSLATSDQNVKQAWGQVQNVYQRRADLIPNLVNTVKGYAKQEQTVLTQVIEARAKASQVTVSPEVLNDSTAFRNFEAAQGQLSQSLGRLLAISEAYPDLKSNQNFLALQDELAGTENRIANERRNFNTAVQDYNSKVVRFPTKILAGMFGFHERPYFVANPGADTAPQVRF